MRSAFLRSEFDLVHTETHVEIPAVRIAEAFFRLLILVAVVGFGLYYLKDKLIPEEKRIVTAESLMQAFQSDDQEAFEEDVADAETELIIDLLSNWQDDPSGSIETRTREFNYQIYAAEKLAKSKMLGRRIDGLSHQLDLRSQLAFFNLENEIADPDTNKQLLDLCRLYKSIQFEEDSQQLNDQSKIGEIIGNLVDYVDQGNDQTETSRISELNAAMEEMIGLLKDNPSGQILKRLSSVVRERLDKEGRSLQLPDVLEQQLDEKHNESMVRRISALVNLDCSSFSATQLDSEEGAFNDAFTVKFRDALDQVLEIGELGNDEYQVILEKLEMLSNSGWNNAAKKMLVSVNQNFNLGELDSDLLARSQLFQSRLSRFGKAITLREFKTLAGRKALFKSNNAFINVMLFISFENRAAFDVKLKEIVKILERSQVPAMFMNLAIILVHDDDKMNGLAALEKTAERAGQVSWWQLNSNWPEFQKFEDILSVDNTPLVLVLDTYSKVTSVDPGAVELQSLIKKMNNRKKQPDP